LMGCTVRIPAPAGLRLGGGMIKKKGGRPPDVEGRRRGPDVSEGGIIRPT